MEQSLNQLNALRSLHLLPKAETDAADHVFKTSQQISGTQDMVEGHIRPHASRVGEGRFACSA